MRMIGASFELTATDLVGHLLCRHLTSLNREVAEGTLPKPRVWNDPLLEVLFERGAAHEQNYIEHLTKIGVDVTRIDGIEVTSEAAAETRAAMQRGVPIIVQGALRTGFGMGVRMSCAALSCQASLVAGPTRQSTRSSPAKQRPEQSSSSVSIPTCWAPRKGSRLSICTSLRHGRSLSRSDIGSPTTLPISGRLGAPCAPSCQARPHTIPIQIPSSIAASVSGGKPVTLAAEMTITFASWQEFRGFKLMN